MNKLFCLFKTNILLPLWSFKTIYLPVIIIYFCYGLSSLTSIATGFWTKDHLVISVTELMHIAFWAGAPWTIKILFSQFIEHVRILGSARKSYIFVGALFIILGNLIMVGAANDYGYSHFFGSNYQQLMLSAVLIATGLVIQDIIADTLAAELVDANLPENDRKNELGIIQVLGRMSLIFGILLASIAGGYLATNYDFKYVVWCGLAIPIFSLLSILFIKKEVIDKDLFINYAIIGSSIAMVLASIFSEIWSFSYNQEIIFCINVLLILYMLKNLCKDYTPEKIREILLVGIMLFAYRMTPEIGAGSEWWQIDVLKFDPQFFSYLKQMGLLLAFLGTWIFSNYLAKQDIAKIIIVLTLLRAIFYLPDLGLAFGLQNWTMEHFGFGAKTIALIDAAIEGPFAVLIMVPMCSFIAFHAPKEQKPTWFALTTCFVNLPFSSAALSGKLINHIFVINRGEYQNIPNIYLIHFVFALLVPIFTVIICNRYRPKCFQL